jgi:hypothetical protein
MKRVLRSAFEPLPRAISTPTLVALVGAVVLGTAVTVHRYLETSEPPPSSAPSSAGTVWASDAAPEAPDATVLQHRRCSSSRSTLGNGGNGSNGSIGSNERGEEAAAYGATQCMKSSSADRREPPAHETPLRNDPASVFRPSAESSQSAGG